MDKYFTGTVSRIGGITLTDIAKRTDDQHSKAFDPLGLETDLTLASPGRHKLRSGGEIHRYNPVSYTHLVPAISSLGAPYFNDKARAALIGMDRSTRPAHLVRAAEECIAYQIRDVVESVTEATGRPLSRLCADGGPTRDRFLMRFQAGLLGMPLLVSETEERCV